MLQHRLGNHTRCTPEVNEEVASVKPSTFSMDVT